MSGNDIDFPQQTCPEQLYPARGSQAWAERVLQLFERDCMDDFQELCVLMGVSVTPVSSPEAEYSTNPDTSCT